MQLLCSMLLFLVCVFAEAADDQENSRKIKRTSSIKDFSQVLKNSVGRRSSDSKLNKTPKLVPVKERKTSSQGAFNKSGSILGSGSPLAKDGSTGSLVFPDQLGDSPPPIMAPRGKRVVFPSLKKLSIKLSPSQSALELREAETEGKAEEPEEGDHQDTMFFIFAGDYTGDKQYYERAKECYEALEGRVLDQTSPDKVEVHCDEDLSKESSDLLSEAMSFPLQEDASPSEHRVSKSEMCRDMLRARGVGVFAGEPNCFFGNAAYLLKNYKYAMEAISAYGVIPKESLGGVEEFVGIAELILATISRLLIADAKKQQEELCYYRKLLFQTIEHRLSGTVEQEVGPYRNMLSGAIKKVFSECGEDQKVCLDSFHSLVVQAADRVLSEKSEGFDKILSDYKELVLEIDELILKKNKQHLKLCLEHWELEVSGATDRIANIVKELEDHHALLLQAEQEENRDEYFTIAGEKKPIMEKCEALVFNEIIHETTPKGEQEPCRYCPRLKLAASKQILHHCIKGQVVKSRENLVSLEQALKLLKIYREQRKPSEVIGMKIDTSRIDVNKIRNDMSDVQEKLAGSEQLQEAFNCFAEKNELERLMDALEALELVEARDCCRKEKEKEDKTEA